MGFPKGWEDFTHIGNVIPGTRIIAFKTPLNSSYFRGQPKDIITKNPNCDWFTPVDVCEAVLDTTNGYHNLGLVIDLTYSYKYYDPHEFKENNVYVTKVMCPGHQIPPEHLVRKFQNCIRDYLYDYPDPYTVIGVHCTHGVNRTGYMIARYLIQREGWSPSDAIAAVSEARGHAIERQNYVDHLHNLHMSPHLFPATDKKDKSSSNSSTQPSSNGSRGTSPRDMSRDRERSTCSPGTSDDKRKRPQQKERTRKRIKSEDPGGNCLSLSVTDEQENGQEQESREEEENEPGHIQTPDAEDGGFIPL